ncbi:AAA family ATPase [Polyangium sp. y55x31]|uniref:AAA family ATPase n=1 Tax=Polyangium sp. y55x31 TaxID=3042688 RepID=UPI0024821FB1|nr:AAA family ATPase [Polyangium sp. y55x31]MDI1478653.1 AAA family ATPase [Polyangium sp. y55x31]
MKITRLGLRQFTVFSDVTFEFAPGVNVFIGENGTGKSHVLKLLYALTEATRRFATRGPLEDGLEPTLPHLVQGMLRGVFQPDDLSSFLSAVPGRATLTLEWERARLEVTLEDDGASSTLTATAEGAIAEVGPPLFIPPREVLSIFPGFASAWLKRESAFDRTYFDLCVALDLKPLRKGGPKALLDPIERELGGNVVMKDGRFYLAYPGGDMEMPMVAEGDRKLAMIAWLLMNGSLSENAYLLWDEPEANLNPKRARLTSDTAAALAHAGVQVFLATHDYALTSELALKVDTGSLRASEAAFHAFRRVAEGPSVVVERGERLAELSNNAILDALASLHAREQEALFTTDEEAPR